MTKGPVWLSDIPRPRALLVVAHPDDETIFAGGFILKSEETEWTVICCVPESGPRREEFRVACKFLAKESANRINPVILGLAPVNDFTLAESLRSYATGYDIVLTHNREGEYGHEDHKLINRCVVGSIAHPNTWVFISPGSKNVNQEELRSKEPGGNVTVCLSPHILSLKRKAFQECHRSEAEKYGYDANGTLRDTDLRETLSWEFESGREQYSFYR